MRALTKSFIVFLVSILCIFSISYFANAQVNQIIWRILSGKIQPVNTSLDVYAPSNLRVDGEIQPDGDTCSDGQILKKTGTNNWDCANESGGGGGDPSLTSTSTDLLGGSLIMTGTIKTATGTPFSLYVGGDLRVDGNATTTGTSYLGGNVLVNGNVTFNTPASQSLRVGAAGTNAPVFLYTPNTNIGMFFDSAVDNAFEFTDSAGATVFQVKALSGNTLSSGVLDINGTGHNDFEGYLTLAAASTGMTAGDLKVGGSATTTNFSVTGNTYFDASTVKMHTYPAFSYSTTTAWTGTTTIPLGPAFVAEQWSSVKCFTDAGTLNVIFHDGTNQMNIAVISTTVGSGTTLSSNNTFTTGEKRYVSIGGPASSPTNISCTVDKIINN